jgi:hypothetical protein
MYYMRRNMKRILIAVLVLLSLEGFAQPGYTTINSRYSWKAGRFVDGLHVPGYNGTPSGVTTGIWIGDGAVAVDTANHRLYIYSGGAWVRVANWSEIGGGLPALGTAGQLLKVNAGATALEYFTPTYVSTRDRFGLSGEDATATSDRTFNIGSNIFKIDGADGDNYVRYNGYEFKHQSFESWDNDFSTIISNPSTFQAQAGRGSTYGQLDANTTYSAVEMLTPDGVAGLENRYEGGVAFSWLAAGNPYTGIYLDRHVGVRIGKGIATND